MKDPRKPGQELASESRLLFALGIVCLCIALLVGALGIGGIFGDAPARGWGAMGIMTFFGVATLASSAGRRRAARLAGWMPAWEQTVREAIKCATAPLPETLSGDMAQHSAEASVPASEEAKPDAQEAAVSPGAPTEAVPAAFANPTKRAHADSPIRKSAAAMMAKEYRETLERLILRSEDAFALARDLASTGKSVDAFADLSTMLALSDALRLQDPPRIKPIRLSRSGRFWMGGDVPEASDETYDAVISLEAAFNIAQDTYAAMAKNPSIVEKLTAQDKARATFTAAGRVKPDYQTRTDLLDLLFDPAVHDELRDSEWFVRDRISNAAENAPLPFRIVFDMHVNVEHNIALVSLQTPRPTCFSIASDDEPEKQALARDYAFRSALFMAQAALGAFGPEGGDGLAVVVCHTRSSDVPILSLKVAPDELPELEQLVSRNAPLQAIAHPNLRMSWEDDWLDPVEPHLEEDDPLFAPERFAMHLELSEEPCSEHVAAATGAIRESDLGIEEGASMRKAWAALECRLAAADTTAEAAVSEVLELQDRADDPAVREACSRVMRALVDGTAEPSQTEQLESVFVGENALGAAMATGALAFASHDGDKMAQAAKQLREALSTGMQIALMDDTESVYRHFRNTAERVVYNRHLADGRRVHLVPGNYYAANEMLVHLLCLLERHDEAVPYADELVRISPLSAGAIVTKARVLEEQSKLFEAIDLVGDYIAQAPTMRDASLAYYRMAYLQWRVGSHEGSAACFRVAIAMHTDIAAQAQTELSELLESDSEQKDYSEEEALEVLQAKGIDIWPREERFAEIARAAIACTNDQLYPAAQQLALAILEYRRDDALIDVYRSLASGGSAQ